jgi:GH15 family glucan-1,4-alpha-glucosidase
LVYPAFVARDLPIGNGSLMVNFDHEYNIRDVYYPHVGQDNQTNGDVSFFGVWCDGKFAWIGDPSWVKRLDYDGDTLVTRMDAHSDSLQLGLTINDAVDFDRDVFIRRVELRNLADTKRTVRLFSHFDPHLSGNAIGDTIFFDPEFNGFVAYKAQRYVLINAASDDQFGFKAFAIGTKEREGYQGTWRDAEDGVFEPNKAIAQGSVDCTGMSEITLLPGAVSTAYIWWIFGQSYKEVVALDTFVRERGAASLLDRTRDYWRLWVKNDVDISRLPEAVQRLYRRSLLIIRTQVDHSGAVIAATDSDIVQFGKDTYTYMWPRDGAIVAMALLQAGYAEITRRFFDFCCRLITPEGFLLHKYNPDGSVGSSWHPWLADGKRQLPIQEDETALVVVALWTHFEKFHDVEFVKPLYKPIIKQMADFLARYREPHTRLPAPSWDLWEERRGIAAFTIGSVWAGLNAAARFTDAFGETAQAEKYRRAAAEIREATSRYLFDEKSGCFARSVNVSSKGEITTDPTLDASMAGLWLFGMFDAGDPKIVATMEAMIARLTIKTDIGGVARYENDYYFQVSKDVQNVAGNPWIVCTLSVAHWYAMQAKTTAELQKAIDILQWACDRALPSGVLAEQLDPYTGAPLSVAPLTWSHAAFVLATHVVARRAIELAEKS